MLLHYLAKCGNKKITFFSLKCCISALPEFNQSLLDFFSLFDLWLILMLLYDSLNLVTNAFSSGLLKIWFRRNEVESTAALGLCCMHNACTPMHCLPERNKCHLWCVWWHVTFVEIVTYPINTVHWLSLQAWRRTTPIFYTATDTVTDLVNIERVGNRQQDAMLPF